MFAPSFVQSVIVKYGALFSSGSLTVHDNMASQPLFTEHLTAVPADPGVVVKATLLHYCHIVTFCQTLLIVIGGGNANRF